MRLLRDGRIFRRYYLHNVEYDAAGCHNDHFSWFHFESLIDATLNGHVNDNTRHEPNGQYTEQSAEYL